MLVFLGVICAWLWLRRQGDRAIFVVVPCIAMVHILSHAILVFMCGMLVLAGFMEKRPLTRRHLALLLLVFFSMGVYVWPQGPYAAMLVDLQQAHLKRILRAGPYLMALPLVGGIALMAAQRRWHWRPHWADAVAASLERWRMAMGLGGCASSSRRWRCRPTCFRRRDGCPTGALGCALFSSSSAT